MSDAAIDRLEIQIEAQAAKANQQLDVLVSKLNNVSVALGSINLRNWTNLSAPIGKVGHEAENSGKKVQTLNKSVTTYSARATKSTKTTNSLARSFGYFYANCFLAIRGIKALGNAIETSMDFQETSNYFEVVMNELGENAALKWKENGYESAEAYANSFSKRAKQLTTKMTGYEIDSDGNATYTGKKNLGMNPNDILQYQAMFAQVSNSIGVSEESALNFSKALTMLGADWASLRNISFDSAWEKFASALAGQSRAVRSLGIDITNTMLQEYAYAYGLEKAVSEMTQAEKAQLRLIAIIDQSKVAFGDLANTIGSPANQIRILQQNFTNLARTIGNIFLPVLQKVLPYINGVVIALQRLFQWIGGLLGIKFESINSAMGGANDFVYDLVGNTDDYTDSLKDASKAAEKLKTITLGIDELNINSPQDSSGSSMIGGAVGGMPELDNAIAAALEKYEKEWNDAFDRMQNRAQEIADAIVGFFKNIWEIAEPTRKALANLWNNGLKLLGEFTWDTLGDFYREFLVPIGRWMLADSAGLPRLFHVLNDMLVNVDWGNLRTSLYNLYQNLSDLAIVTFDALFDFVEYFLAPLGTWVMSSALPQLADILSKFIEDVHWEEINSALERFWQALEPFAEALGQGIINFYADLMSFGTGFINVVVPGGINALAFALEKMDPRTIEKIGYALGALLTAYMGFRAVKGLQKIVSNTWNALYGAEVISGLKKVAGWLGTLAETVPIVTSALTGNKNAANALATFYPKLNSMIIGVSDTFETFRANLQSGAFFKNTLADMQAWGQGLSTVQKGAITAVAAFIEFNVVKNTFEDLTLGTENLLTAIGKIAVTVGAAGLAMYVALGPAGVVIAAITGVVAAIMGINSAFDEIKENSAMEAVGNALKNPGGTPLEEITANYQTAISEIGGGFDTINKKSSELETTKQNVKQTTDSIDLIAFAMENGTAVTAEKIDELTGLFEQLVVDSESLFEQEYNIIMTALAGSLGDAVEQAGLKIPEFVAQLDKLKTDYQRTLDEITQSNATLAEELSAGEITQAEYAQSLMENYQKIAELTGKTDEYTKSVNSVSDAVSGVDFSQFVNEDNTLNTAALAEEFDNLATTAINAKDTINLSSETVTGALTDMQTKFQALGDETGVEFVGKALSAEADNVTKATEEVDSALVIYGDKIQTALLENIPNVVDEALADYESKGWLYKATHTEEEHIQAALDTYQTNVIDKAAEELEKMYSDMGIEGATWASEAGKEIIAGLFDTKTVFSEFGNDVRYQLKDNYTEIVTGALEDAKLDIENSSKKRGEDTVAGYNKGIVEKAPDTMKAVSVWMGDTEKAIHDSSMRFGSPSATAWDFGKDTIQGYNNGIIENASSTKTVIDNWLNGISGLLTIEKWSEMFNTMKTGMQTKWLEITAWWNEEAITLWFEESVLFWFSLEKWLESTDGMKLGIQEKWLEITTWWNEEAMPVWFEEGIAPWFTLEKWHLISLGIQTGIIKRWDEFALQWKERFKAWWDKDVAPWFMVEKWQIFGENMKNGIMMGFEGIVQSITDTMNALLSVFESALNELSSAVNSFIEDYNSIALKLGGESISSISSFSIGKVSAHAFADGGIVNRPTISLMGEAGPEAIVPLKNNTEWIDGVATRIAEMNHQKSTEEIEEQNELLREQNELLRMIANKEIKAVFDTREALQDLNEQSVRQGYKFA